MPARFPNVADPNLADKPEDAIDNEVDAAVDGHEEVVSLSEFVICFPNMLKQKID